MEQINLDISHLMIFMYVSLRMSESLCACLCVLYVCDIIMFLRL